MRFNVRVHVIHPSVTDASAIGLKTMRVPSLDFSVMAPDLMSVKRAAKAEFAVRHKTDYRIESCSLTAERDVIIVAGIGTKWSADQAAVRRKALKEKSRELILRKAKDIRSAAKRQIEVIAEDAERPKKRRGKRARAEVN